MWHPLSVASRVRLVPPLLSCDPTQTTHHQCRSIPSLLPSSCRRRCWKVSNVFEVNKCGARCGGGARRMRHGGEREAGTHPHHRGSVCAAAWGGGGGSGGVGGRLDQGPGVAGQHSGLHLDPHPLALGDLHGSAGGAGNRGCRMALGLCGHSALLWFRGALAVARGYRPTRCIEPKNLEKVEAFKNVEVSSNQRGNMRM